MFCSFVHPCENKGTHNGNNTFWLCAQPGEWRDPLCFHPSNGKLVQVWFRGASVQRPDPQCFGQPAVTPGWSKPTRGQGTVENVHTNFQNSFFLIVDKSQTYRANCCIISYKYRLCFCISPGVQVCNESVCSCCGIRADHSHVSEPPARRQELALWRVYQWPDQVPGEIHTGKHKQGWKGELCTFCIMYEMYQMGLCKVSLIWIPAGFLLLFSLKIEKCFSGFNTRTNHIDSFQSQNRCHCWTSDSYFCLMFSSCFVVHRFRTFQACWTFITSQSSSSSRATGLRSEQEPPCL